jgi:hypothetical protein
MPLVVLGAILIVVGVALAAVRTAQRGRLSQANTRGASSRPDTLEPSGEGRRLSLKADLPGLGLIALGALLMVAGLLA